MDERRQQLGTLTNGLGVAWSAAEYLIFEYFLPGDERSTKERLPGPELRIEPASNNRFSRIETGSSVYSAFTTVPGAYN